jgi:hypothetical protein
MVLTVALVVLAAGAVLAADAIRYEITPEKVERTWVEEGPGATAWVNVELAGVHGDDFSMLTSRITGRTLEIIFRGRVLDRSVVREKVDSGVIRLPAGSMDDAKSLGTDIGGGG